MSQFLRSRWFLLLVVGGLVGAWLWPETLGRVVVQLPPLYVVGAALLLTALGMETKDLFAPSFIRGRLSGR